MYVRTVRFLWHVVLFSDSESQIIIIIINSGIPEIFYAIACGLVSSLKSQVSNLKFGYVSCTVLVPRYSKYYITVLHHSVLYVTLPFLP